MGFVDTLKGLYAEKLKVDDREAAFEFRFPFPDDDATYAVYLPRLVFWNQLFGLVILQMLLQVLSAVIVYQLVVKSRRKGRKETAYLVGSACLPLSLCAPFLILDALDVRNFVIRLALVSFPTIVFFRTIEAMFGTSPATVETSLRTYVEYYTSLMHFDWDPKTATRRNITSAETGKSATKILYHFLLVSLVLSFEMHFNYQPFASDVKLDSFEFSWNLFHPSHLGNAYVLAILTYLMLAVGFDLTAFSENIKGHYTKPIFFNPLLESRSPSEFWGQRWNLMIHRILKHGAFLPAKLFFGTKISIFITFLFSGLLHDYTWAVVFYQHSHQLDANGHCLDCFTPITLKLTAFFAWNGVVMLLEKPLTKYFGFTRSWPSFVVATLVLLTALPVSHWYTGDWAVGGKYTDFRLGLITIRKL